VVELNDIVHGLEPELGAAEGPPEPLEGGITNRNYRVRMGAQEYVVRLHGKDTQLLGISRESEARASAAAAELGIAPDLAATFEGGMVTTYVPCEGLSERQVADRAEEIASVLRRFHSCPVELPSAFRVPELLERYGRTLAERGADPPAELETARRLAATITSALPPCEPRPCHNDLLPGNVIREASSGRVMIVDWEYAGMGDPWFDLGNLAVNNEFDEAVDERLLRAYQGGEPSPAQRARLKLMRLMSDVREAAWGVMQARVSDLDFDFEGYGERHFQRLRRASEGGALESWLSAVAEGA
jgi:thiamine kinase-like enzyme